jgi:hypothetical protein
MTNEEAFQFLSAHGVDYSFTIAVLVDAVCDGSANTRDYHITYDPAKHDGYAITQLSERK